MKEAKEPPEPIGLAWIPILILPDGTVEEPLRTSRFTIAGSVGADGAEVL